LFNSKYLARLEDNRHACQATKSTEKSAKTVNQMFYTQGALDAEQAEKIFPYQEIFDAPPSKPSSTHAGARLQGGTEYICGNPHETAITIFCEIERDEDHTGNVRDPKSTVP
jgi:hypothetical protein